MRSKAPFYLRQWRKHRGYTLERLSEMAGMSVGNLSDLERGKHGFNQAHLEHFAELLRCRPQDLIMRDPTAPQPIWSIWDDVPETQRGQALEVLKAFTKTGTNG